MRRLVVRWTDDSVEEFRADSVRIFDGVLHAYQGRVYGADDLLVSIPTCNVKLWAWQER